MSENGVTTYTTGIVCLYLLPFVLRPLSQKNLLLGSPYPKGAGGFWVFKTVLEASAVGTWGSCHTFSLWC